MSTRRMVPVATSHICTGPAGAALWTPKLNLQPVSCTMSPHALHFGNAGRLNGSRCVTLPETVPSCKNCTEPFRAGMVSALPSKPKLRRGVQGSVRASRVDTPCERRMPLSCTDGMLGAGKLGLGLGRLSVRVAAKVNSSVTWAPCLTSMKSMVGPKDSEPNGPEKVIALARLTGRGSTMFAEALMKPVLKPSNVCESAEEGNERSGKEGRNVNQRKRRLQHTPVKEGRMKSERKACPVGNSDQRPPA